MPVKSEIKEIKCQVCRSPVIVDECYNSDEPCWICGWIPDGYSRHSTDSWTIDNIISLDKARQLYKQGKPLKPDFEDFMDFYDGYGEVRFVYKGIVYAMDGGDNGDSVDIWACDVPVEDRHPIKFSSVDDFIAHAMIDGVLIKDLWDEVTECGPMH